MLGWPEAPVVLPVEVGFVLDSDLYLSYNIQMAERQISRREALRFLGKVGGVSAVVAAGPAIPLLFGTDRDPKQPTLDAKDMSVEQLVIRVKEFENRGKLTFAMAKAQGRDLTYLFVKSGQKIGLEDATSSDILNARAESLFQRMVFLPDFERESPEGAKQVKEDNALAARYAQGDFKIPPESSHLIQWLQKTYPQEYANMSETEKQDLLTEVYIWTFVGWHNKGRVFVNLREVNSWGSRFTQKKADWQNVPADSGPYLCLPITPAVAFRTTLFHEAGHEDAYDFGGKDRPLDPDLIAAYQSIVNDPQNIAKRPQEIRHPLTLTGGTEHNYGFLLTTADPKVSINYTGMLEFVNDIISSYKVEKLGLSYVRPEYDTEIDFRNMQKMLKDIDMSMRQLRDLYYSSQLETFLFRLGSKLLTSSGQASFSKMDAYKEAIRLFSPGDTDEINWNQTAGDNQLNWKQFPLQGLDTKSYVLGKEPNAYYYVGAFPLEIPLPVPCWVPRK